MSKKKQEPIHLTIDEKQFAEAAAEQAAHGKKMQKMLEQVIGCPGYFDLDKKPQV